MNRDNQSASETASLSSMTQKVPKGLWIAALATVAGAGAALFNRNRARAAQAQNPPQGKFIEVDGVPLHYVERGEGKPIVLLHGNGAMIHDMEASGVLSAASERYRVIAFDRPGYGYSERPSGTISTPQAQGALFAKAIDMLGIEKPIILGHSWGTMVALAMALDHGEAVSALVLVSGYYYPTARPDVAQHVPTATPVIGTLLSNTLTPLIARAMMPLQVRMAFRPAPVAESFGNFPRSMTLRPEQMRTCAIEGSLMLSAAASLCGRYAELDLPVEILAGEGDRIAFPDRHSQRLHREIRESRLRIVAGTGHMIHYTAPEEVLAAIDRASARADERLQMREAGHPVDASGSVSVESEELDPVLLEIASVSIPAVPQLLHGGLRVRISPEERWRAARPPEGDAT